jgi:ribosomal protein L20A (L18A)
MSAINILALNSTILEKIKSEEHVEKKIQLLDSLMAMNLEPCVFDVLNRTKQNVLKEKRISRSLFLSRTHGLIMEYLDIIKQPISHDKKDSIPVLKRKTDLVSKYLDIVRELVKEKEWTNIDVPPNPSVSDFKNDHVCPSCKNDDPERFETDEFYRKTCLNCSMQQFAIETGITHRDYARVNVVGKFIYNRDLHFQDCIKQYQGKQNCKIPEKLYQDLDAKFKAYRLLVPINSNQDKSIKYSKITRDHIMTVLKELKYTKHYENTNLIYYTLTNKRVDDISHLEEQLMKDFKELVSLYDEIHGKDKSEELERKNFMNVQYILYQLLKRHGHNCNINNFTILKTVDRKLFHDTICKNLFDKLGWKFTPTF